MAYKAREGYRGRKMRHLTHIVFQGGGRVFLSLCDRVVSPGMPRALTISGRQRQRLKERPISRT